MFWGDGKEEGYGLAETTKNGYGPDKDIPMTPVYSGHEVLSYHEDDFDVMRLQKYYFDADLMNVVSNMLFKKRIERLQDIMFEANPYCIEAEEVVDEEDDDDCKDTPGKDLKKIQLITNGSTPVDSNVEIYCRFMFLYYLEPKVIRENVVKKKKEVQVSTHYFLPIPTSITDNFGINYTTPEIGAIGGAIVDIGTTVGGAGS